MDFWEKLFSGADFMARRYCGDWSVGLIWLHVVSDAVIFVSYLWIPLTMFLAFRVHGSKLVIPRAAWLLISLYITFIAACGFTHFFDLLMFWNPVYRVNGLVRALTAVVSFLTAATLSRLIPVAITAPIQMNVQKRLVEQQQAWLRDILDAATGGILRLCASPAELPAALAEGAHTVRVSDARDLSAVRKMVTHLVHDAGFPRERADGLVTATHEAAMNALRHAGGGTVRGYRHGDTAQVWVEDAGRGIALDKLPIATLKQGYSTMGTAGQGWFLMLSFVDAAFLYTDATGTTIVLEMRREPPIPLIPLSHWVGGDIPSPEPAGLAA
ncbi:MAG: ATP-binding protein [Armatimonadetes bacterium]|nr:ATP-binding protein [Armatimonadota bacterium]